ncbi:MAG: hypothetical protein ACREOJ_04625 [Gemmatimonadaceae bacterium]
MRSCAAMGPAVMAVVAVVAGCGGGKGNSAAPAMHGATHPGATGAPGATSATGGGAPGGGAIQPASTGWSVPEVVRRLTDAGLVVMDSAQTARHEPLTVSAHVLHVSGGTLELYLYPDAALRERESAKLDTNRAGLPSIYNARYIESGNLIAILHAPSDRTAERVTNVLEGWHNEE